MDTDQQRPRETVLNLGSLRSQISLTLHTHHASRVWFGRRASEKDRGVIGMGGFLATANTIHYSASRDDPYADYALIQLEEKINDAKQKMEALRDQVRKMMEKVPQQISISENLNVQPVTLPVFANGGLGFQVVFLLTEYDEFVRDVLLATHIGLLARDPRERLLEQGAHLLRSVFGVAQHYKNAGITRAELAAGGQRAKDAIAKFGELPQDILDRSRRSDFAPPIRVAATANQEDDEPTDSGDGE